MTPISSNGEVLEIPGSYSGPLSPRPFFDSVNFLRKIGSYVEGRREKVGGDPVFRAHVGFPMILVTDNEAAKFLFQAPLSLVERAGPLMVGPTFVRNELAGGCLPAAFSRGAVHADANRFTQGIVEYRAEAFEEVMHQATDRWARDLAKKGSAEIASTIADWGGDFAFQWLFEEPAPPGDDLLNWTKSVFGLKGYNPMGRLLARFLAPKPHPTAPKVAAELEELARRSVHYERYRQIAADCDIPERELAGLLAFTAVVNIAGGPIRLLIPSIPSILHHRPVYDRLYEELKDFDGSLEELDALPYLDCVLKECLRLYTRPRYFFREAQRDFELPCGNGSRYQVRLGETLGIVASFVHMDPLVFDQPKDFEPERFERYPELSERVWGWGQGLADKNLFGCIGKKTGQAPLTFKAAMATLVRDHTFSFSPEPLFSLDEFLMVGPEGLKIVDFKRLG